MPRCHAAGGHLGELGQGSRRLSLWSGRAYVPHSNKNGQRDLFETSPPSFTHLVLQRDVLEVYRGRFPLLLALRLSKVASRGG